MAQPVNPLIRRFQNMDALGRASADAIVEVARSAVEKTGRFTLVLAGGRTPHHLYTLLAKEYSNEIPWARTHLFWGDERYVSIDHPESNYKMAYDTLISKLEIPGENVHPIPVESGDPEEDASAYEDLLHTFFKTSPREGLSGTFDLVLLGLGEDGHTASLFPGDPILNEKNRLVRSVLAPVKYKTQQRITLTLSAFNRSENVFFLVVGEKKRNAVNSIMRDEAKRTLPAARVRPKGTLVWFLDEEAASGL